MVVTIRFYGILKDIVKEKLELNIESSEISFLDLITEVLKKYPTLGNFIRTSNEGIEVRGLSILVNGRHIIFLGGDKALIRNGDVVDILPPLHGG